MGKWIGNSRKKFSDKDFIKIKLCNSPSDFDLTPFNTFDLCISLETLEHLKTSELDKYLSIIQKNLRGFSIITVPYEKDILFLIKYLVKLFLGEAENYTFRELVYATVGHCYKIDQDNHKGSDYKNLEKMLSQYSKVDETTGVQTRHLPKFFNTKICFF